MKPCYKKLSEVLSCFIHHDDGVKASPLFVGKEKIRDLSVETYIFDSQKWPVEEYEDIPSTVWKHKVIFYVPEHVEHQTVLLYVNGGYNRGIDGKDQNFNSPKEQLDYARFARNNKAIVVELQEVPNQHLVMNGTYKKEDQYIAYTYKKVMEDPLKNAYLAGHLPMAKATIKAMDFVQSVLEKEHKIANARFVISGASKRGWTVWLAALEDERIDAMIPIHIDILNTQKSIKHICEVYKACPVSMRDYEEEGLTDRIGTQEFADLMKIEDPFLYLGAGYNPKYKKRMAIPKFLINASGDDFFVPDSSKWYFKDVPGDANYIRYLPNAAHYIKGARIWEATETLSLLNQAVDTYFGLYLKKSPLPKLEWKLNKESIEIESSQKPKALKLWTAFNEDNRDFRFLNKHDKWHLWIKTAWTYVTNNVCDVCYVPKELELSKCTNEPCKLEIPLESSKKPTWRASYVEAHYEIDGKDFILSTEVSIEALSSQ